MRRYLGTLRPCHITERPCCFGNLPIGRSGETLQRRVDISVANDSGVRLVAVGDSTLHSPATSLSRIASPVSATSSRSIHLHWSKLPRPPEASDVAGSAFRSEVPRSFQKRPKRGRPPGGVPEARRSVESHKCIIATTGSFEHFRERANRPILFGGGQGNLFVYVNENPENRRSDRECFGNSCCGKRNDRWNSVQLDAALLSV